MPDSTEGGGESLLTAEHREILDLGTHSTDPVDYSDYAEASVEPCARTRPNAASCSAGAALARRWPRTGFPVSRRTVPRHLFGAPGRRARRHERAGARRSYRRCRTRRELIGAFLNARFSGEERHRRRLAKMIALENPLRALQVFGQSVWLDYIRRSLITGGELRRLIDEDGLRG